MRFFIRLVALCLFLLPSFVMANGPEDTLEDMLAQVGKKTASITTLASSFTQKKQLAMFDETLVSTGVMYYQKPDRLHWEYLTPRRMGFFMDGKDMIHWRGTESGAMEGPGASVLAEQLLAWTSFDLEWLRERYSMQLVKTSPLVLKLTPKSAKVREFISALQVTFNTDLKTVREVKLTEKDGDSTVLTFDRVVVNKALPKQAFKPHVVQQSPSNS